MKNQKLITGFLMLLITTVALTTASYAWFIVTTTVAVAGLDIDVAAAEGIQISTDAVTWKSSLTLADITTNAYTGNTNQTPTRLKPVSTIGSQAVGTFAFFDGSIEDAGTLAAVAAAAEADGTTGNYVAFDIFVKAAAAEDIWLASASSVKVATDLTMLENSVRVAFFDQGTDATSTPATAIALAAGTSSTQEIWEPNALGHTTYALANGATAGVKFTPYYGVKAIGTGITQTYSLMDEDTTHYGAISTTITPDTDGSPFAKTAGNVIFNVTAGISKIRVYVWVEGQDIDCENSVSLGAENVVVTISFEKSDV